MKPLGAIALLALISLQLPLLADEAANDTVTENASQKPNFLIIVADDMGWSDVSPFGSEIRTPALQQLADEGLAMGQFEKMWGDTTHWIN